MLAQRKRLARSDAITERTGPAGATATMAGKSLADYAQTLSEWLRIGRIRLIALCSGAFVTHVATVGVGVLGLSRAIAAHVTVWMIKQVSRKMEPSSCRTTSSWQTTRLMGQR